MLDEVTANWIDAALKATPHGEIILTVQDHKVLGVDIRGRRRVLQPHVDKSANKGDSSG